MEVPDKYHTTDSQNLAPAFKSRIPVRNWDDSAGKT